MTPLYPGSPGRDWLELPRILAGMRMSVVTPEQAQHDKQGIAPYMERLKAYQNKAGSVPKSILPEYGQTNSIYNENYVKEQCDALGSPNSAQVVQALKMLRKMEAPEAVPAILPCLQSSNPGVVRDACRTLAVLGNKDVIPSIEPLLTNSRKDVRKDAQDAIDKLNAK
jgi:hypothetical protein